MSIIYFITTQDIDTFQKNYRKRYLMPSPCHFRYYLINVMPRLSIPFI